MITAVCQRWRDRRGTYRPAREVIDTRRYEVALIERMDAKAFVTRHHYSRSWPAERASVGLFRGPALVGVATVSEPMHSRVLAP